ncbi:hypothetical protein ACOSQ3_013176 [Xanthoceras sorbifolium]
MVVMGLWVIGLKRTEIRLNSLGNLLRDFIKFSIRATSLTTTKFAQLSSLPLLHLSPSTSFSTLFQFILCAFHSFFSHFSQLFLFYSLFYWLFSFSAHYPYPYHLFYSTPSSSLNTYTFFF